MDALELTVDLAREVLLVAIALVGLVGVSCLLLASRR
jgi:hypothetical protein